MKTCALMVTLDTVPKRLGSCLSPGMSSGYASGLLMGIKKTAFGAGRKEGALAFDGDGVLPVIARWEKDRVWPPSPSSWTPESVRRC